MLHVCPACGHYAPKLLFDKEKSEVICPDCGHRTAFPRLPLFLITGSSCAGKSTLTRELFLHNYRVAAIESDILWDEKWREAGDNFRAYRAMWLRLCQNISHAGKPVVLCGCCDPGQFADQPEAGFFSGLHFLAVVCRDEILEHRMDRRGLNDPETRKGNLRFNRWFWENHDKTNPPITLLDTSELSPGEAAARAGRWIDTILEKEMPYGTAIS